MTDDKVYDQREDTYKAAMDLYKANRQPPPPMIRREFFWSARTLRANIFDGDGDVVCVQDILRVDRLGCILAHPAYGELIVQLLQTHFDDMVQLLQPDPDPPT